MGFIWHVVSAGSEQRTYLDDPKMAITRIHQWQGWQGWQSWQGLLLPMDSF